MIPYANRIVSYFDTKNVLEVRILEVEEESGEEKFVLEVEKIIKEEFQGKYKKGDRIKDQRDIGEDCMKSGFCITLENI